MIKEAHIREAVEGLMQRAVIRLPDDVVKAIRKAHDREKGIAKTNLKAILDNIEYAKENKIPLCQDTGLPVFYATVGTLVKIDQGIIKRAVNEGVRNATVNIPLRPNIVDPFSRKNSGDNTGPGIPVIYVEFAEGGDHIELVALPKGAGSENMSALRMLNPSEGTAGIERFVVETVASAGANPCPPTIIGVGVGGTADLAMQLSKKALLRPIGSKNGNRNAEELERSILDDINDLGIGPMGLGGDTTSLAVKIEYAFCHTASLPVAVSIQCWADRKASVRVSETGFEFL